MIVRAFGVAIALSTIFSQPALAAAPVGGWKIEPSDVRCVAVHQYGDPAKPIILALKISPIENALQLAIIRSGYRKGPVQTKADLKIDGESLSISALSYPQPNNKHRVVHLINLDPDQAASLQTAKLVDVAIEEGINDDFPLGDMSETWSGMKHCVEGLRKTWNLGPESGTKLASDVKGDIQGIFTEADYPQVAWTNDQQGTAMFILLIDENGQPKDCTVAGSSGAALLDSRSCGVVMARAKFKPALDTSGKPVKSSWQQSVTWRLSH